MLISKKEPYGKKKAHSMKLHSNTIAFDDHDYIGPLCIKLPQMIRYIKCFDNNKTISFRVTDNNLLEKYGETWRKVSKILSLIENLFMGTLINA